jgi:hypothetical protein
VEGVQAQLDPEADAPPLPLLLGEAMTENCMV